MFYNLIAQLTGNTPKKVYLKSYRPYTNDMGNTGFTYNVEVTRSNFCYMNVFVAGKCQITKSMIRNNGKIPVRFHNIKITLRANQSNTVKEMYCEAEKIILLD